MASWTDLPSITNESLDKALILSLRKHLDALTDEQRLEFFCALGYCRECGRIDREQRCQCWNDE
jgi:hypothetical protein